MNLLCDDELLIPAESFEPGAGALPDQLARWRDCVGPALDVSVDADRMPRDWSTRTTGWNLGGVMVVRGHYDPQTLTRRASSVVGDKLDHYVLHLNQSPHAMHLDANGRRISVGPRQLLVSDFAQPRSVSCEGDVLSVFIPRASLDALMPRQLDLHGVVPTGACSTILASHLQSLSTLLPRITRKEAPDAMVATLQLLAASLAPTIDMLGLARPAVEGTLMRQIRQYMEDHLGEEDLGADSICGHFRISRSTLYRLFEAEGGVLNYLQDRRLVRIHGLLASPTQRSYLGRIAADNGFKSATHFSRAFRAKFGYSPRETRSGQVCLTGARGVQGSPALGSTFGRWLASAPVTA
ncbi:helix-turn-helix domain-containing protein [Variovorax sp. dw_954]|uniref:helix-turn-helix domain-containing protein n=1 Tax=Variovorax sp. dw_954 TaxID=2720078 RepID=UPI001BD1DBF0|nr:helix-turn-helix domain-containing protein [Variovorax sp. dw_954]